MSKEKWYKPSKIHTGWDKDMKENERRARMLNAHKGDYLAAGRAMQSLSNVTEDSETRIKARNDALYFYRKHRESIKIMNSKGIRLTPKFRRLPR